MEDIHLPSRAMHRSDAEAPETIEPSTPQDLARNLAIVRLPAELDTLDWLSKPSVSAEKGDRR